MPRLLHTYWSFGTIVCVLVIEGRSPRVAVQVRDGRTTLLTEPAADPDDAAKRAEALFATFTAHCE